MIRPIHKFGLWKSSSSLFSWEYSQIDHDDHLMGNKRKHSWIPHRLADMATYLGGVDM